MENKLNHFDAHGNAIMVDVGGKQPTERIAIAEGTIRASKDVIEAISSGTNGKGDVIAVARVAGIMATKRTSDLIPLCHPLMLNNAKIDFEIDEENTAVHCTCTVKLFGNTGVEMEALTGVSVALLTVYDMCKAADKSMEIGEIRLVRKEGGKSGVFENPNR